MSADRSSRYVCVPFNEYSQHFLEIDDIETSPIPRSDADEPPLFDKASGAVETEAPLVERRDRRHDGLDAQLHCAGLKRLQDHAADPPARVSFCEKAGQLGGAIERRNWAVRPQESEARQRATGITRDERGITGREIHQPLETLHADRRFGVGRETVLDIVIKDSGHLLHVVRRERQQFDRHQRNRSERCPAASLPP